MSLQRQGQKNKKWVAATCPFPTSILSFILIYQYVMMRLKRGKTDLFLLIVCVSYTCSFLFTVCFYCFCYSAHPIHPPPETPSDHRCWSYAVIPLPTCLIHTDTTPHFHNLKLPLGRKRDSKREKKNKKGKKLFKWVHISASGIALSVQACFQAHLPFKWPWRTMSYLTQELSSV